MIPNPEPTPTPVAGSNAIALSGMALPIIAGAALLLLVLLAILIGRGKKANTASQAPASGWNTLFGIALIVFIPALGFAAYKLYEYSQWLFITPQDWLVIGIAAGVVFIALILLIIAGQKRKAYTAAHGPLGLLFWLCLLLFLAALIFAGYKLYQYSGWMYISPQDWLVVGIAAGVAFLALIGLIAFSRKPRKNAMPPAQPYNAGWAVPSQPLPQPVAYVPEPQPFVAPPAASAPASAPKRNAIPTWVGVMIGIAGLAAAAIAFTTAMNDNKNNNGYTSSGSDPCARERAALEWWGNCNCTSSHHNDSKVGAMYACDVIARGAEGCYTDSHGIRMCSSGKGPGYISAKCMESGRPTICK